MGQAINGSGRKAAPAGPLRERFARETEQLIDTLSSKNEQLYEEIAVNEEQIADARAMLQFLKTGATTTTPSPRSS